MNVAFSSPLEILDVVKLHQVFLYKEAYIPLWLKYLYNFCSNILLKLDDS